MYHLQKQLWLKNSIYAKEHKILMMSKNRNEAVIASEEKQEQRGHLKLVNIKRVSENINAQKQLEKKEVDNQEQKEQSEDIEDLSNLSEIEKLQHWLRLRIYKLDIKDDYKEALEGGKFSFSELYSQLRFYENLKADIAFKVYLITKPYKEKYDTALARKLSHEILSNEIDIKNPIHQKLFLIIKDKFTNLAENYEEIEKIYESLLDLQALYCNNAELSKVFEECFLFTLRKLSQSNIPTKKLLDYYSLFKKHGFEDNISKKVKELKSERIIYILNLIMSKGSKSEYESILNIIDDRLESEDSVFLIEYTQDMSLKENTRNYLYKKLQDKGIRAEVFFREVFLPLLHKITSRLSSRKTVDVKGLLEDYYEDYVKNINVKVSYLESLLDNFRECMVKNSYQAKNSSGDKINVVFQESDYRLFRKYYLRTRDLYLKRLPIFKRIMTVISDFIKMLFKRA